MNDFEECCICLNAINNLTLNCNHSFCRSCIINVDDTLRVNVCPICRMKIKIHDSVKSNFLFVPKKYLDKINWFALARNPNCIDLLEIKHLYKIDWFAISQNPNCIGLLYHRIQIVLIC
jgi:hypothetical protein